MDDNIKRLVSFRIETDLCGIDIMSAQEIVKMHYIRKLPNTPYFLEGMLNLRGDVIPVINLKKLFKFKSFDFIKGRNIIILKFGKDRFGIVIDRVLKVVPVSVLDIKDAPTNLPKDFQKYIVGVTEDQGNIISIMDIEGIAKRANEELKKIDIIGNAHISHRRSGISFLTLEEEKEVHIFLRKIGFKINIVTDLGIKNYFYRLKIKTDKPISLILQETKGKIDRGETNPFSKVISDSFFDITDDFYILTDLFEQVILPSKKSSKKLRILNISCGVGFDIYSVLFILSSYLREDNWQFDFIGTDDSEDNLSKAREANYKLDALKRISSNNYSLFFDRQEEGIFSIKDNLRNTIDFRLLNFSDYLDIPIKDIDLCIIRGSLISLDKDFIGNFLKSISNALGENGILFLGGIEDLYFFDNLPLVQKEINLRRYYVRVGKTS